MKESCAMAQQGVKECRRFAWNPAHLALHSLSSAHTARRPTLSPLTLPLQALATRPPTSQLQSLRESSWIQSCGGKDFWGGGFTVRVHSWVCLPLRCSRRKGFGACKLFFLLSQRRRGWSGKAMWGCTCVWGPRCPCKICVALIIYNLGLA